MIHSSITSDLSNHEIMKNGFELTKEISRIMRFYSSIPVVVITELFFI